MQITEQLTQAFTVIVVDDDSSARTAICRIAEDLGASVVGEAADGHTAISLAQSLSPDILLLDVSMPGMGGFAVARELRESMPALPIIFISQQTARPYVEEAMTVGVRGYVLKEAAQRDLGNAVDAIAAGGTFISPAILARHSKTGRQ